MKRMSAFAVEQSSLNSTNLTERGRVLVCERQKLLRQIQIHNFAITDVVLYLDGHPTCQPALAYYEKHKQLRDEAVALYNQRFGPLNMRENTNPNRWTWVDDPWPWELEA